MSEGLWNLIDSRTCHQCGKEMSVLWPQLWRYKRRNPHTGFVKALQNIKNMKVGYPAGKENE